MAGKVADHDFVLHQVNANGFVSFGSDLQFVADQDITTLADSPIVAPFWADIDTASTGAIYYRLV